MRLHSGASSRSSQCRVVEFQKSMNLRARLPLLVFTKLASFAVKVLSSRALATYEALVIGTLCGRLGCCD